ncbi:MAG: hypothetical protein LKM36_01110 [Flavobacteriales bacterium]|jgi:hypothetical protein|nr:hypothetical protein [Flavobacteriales bacterium]
MSTVKHSTKQNLFFKINLLLIAAGLFAIAEARLPARDVISPVRVVKEYGYTRQGGAERSWSVVIMEDGSYIWTQRTTDRFDPLDSFDLHVTPIMGSVLSYRKHGSLQSWMEVERENDRYRPFPYVVVLVGLLLLLPFWSADSRLFLQGLLLLVSATWALTQFATGGYVFKLLAQIGW